MRKSVAVLLFAAFAAGFSLSTLARGPAGGGGFSHGSARLPPSAPAAIENSNGRFAQDRAKGLDRAEERMSDQALTHENAADAHESRRGAVRTKESTKQQKKD